MSSVRTQYKQPLRHLSLWQQCSSSNQKEEQSQKKPKSTRRNMAETLHRCCAVANPDKKVSSKCQRLSADNLKRKRSPLIADRTTWASGVTKGKIAMFSGMFTWQYIRLKPIISATWELKIYIAQSMLSQVMRPLENHNMPCIDKVLMIVSLGLKLLVSMTKYHVKIRDHVILAAEKVKRIQLTSYSSVKCIACCCSIVQAFGHAFGMGCSQACPPYLQHSLSLLGALSPNPHPSHLSFIL